MSDVIRLSKKKKNNKKQKKTKKQQQQHLSRRFTSTRKGQTNLKWMPPQIFSESPKRENKLH